jgi:hypothetical protein
MELQIPFFNQYLAKHNFVPKLKEAPLPITQIAVVIPSYNEPDIIPTLDSLWNCDRPQNPVEVIIVLNYPENSSDNILENYRISFSQVNEWISIHQDGNLYFHVIEALNMPQKFAGVGLARKTGMDEAIYRFSLINNQEGIICGFDADATVDKNYLTSIENHFKEYPKTPGASIYFEHPVDKIENCRLKSGIVQYELHLRYLVRSIAFTGFPYAYHTVGSSFAVKALAYVKQGGMNKFKAGEDFYFLNKIMPLGGYTEINNTRVIPQARISNRVPFGTGASMTKWMESTEEELPTYNFASLEPLKRLFQNIESIYSSGKLGEEMITDSALWQFLRENESDKAVSEILSNSSSLNAFTKRFYNWFDAFKIVKYLNFAALTNYPKKAIQTEATELLSRYIKTDDFSLLNLLQIYRNWDKTGGIIA